MKIRLNGDPYDLPGAMTILQLLEHLDIDPRRVAIEHNLAIIKRDRYATTTIVEGDTVEVVNFVGGGQGGAPRSRSRRSAPAPAACAPASEPRDLESGS